MTRARPYITIWIFWVLLLSCIVFILHTGGRSDTVLVSEEGSCRYQIYLPTEDQDTRMAARYLAAALETRAGARPTVVSRLERQGSPCFFILKEPAPADAAGKAYDVEIDEIRNIRIHVYGSQLAFSVVKAVCDRWLQDDCGLQKGGKLLLSPPMIAEQLSDLSLEIPGQIRLMTQNLRIPGDADGNSVEERAPRFFALVEDYQPDVIGTQEVTAQWLALLEEHLSDTYEIMGCAREGREAAEGERCVLLYRRDRFTFLDGDTFWLSDTPMREGSKFEYDGFPRICTWVLLHDVQTDKEFFVANTHLQNGKVSPYPHVRMLQLQSIFDTLQRQGELPDRYPGFLTGDFNMASTGEDYSYVLSIYNDAEEDSLANDSRVNYTFHGYGTAHRHPDYCFYSPGSVTILNCRILDDDHGGYVSDHYGVLYTALLHDPLPPLVIED